MIASAEADAVAVLEACNRRVAEALASRLGMALAFGEANCAAHVAWLTRLDIRAARNHRLADLAKTLLEIEVEIDGERWHLFAAHLASSHEEALHPRHEELGAILRVLALAPPAHLLVGDLNSLQPGDPAQPPPGVEARGEARPGASRAVLPLLTAAGYVDCFRALHRDAAGHTFPASAPWLRLDYAFAAPELAGRLARCDVLVDTRARRSSDHLPLVVEFDPALPA